MSKTDRQKRNAPKENTLVERMFMHPSVTEAPPNATRKQEDACAKADAAGSLQAVALYAQAAQATGTHL